MKKFIQLISFLITSVFVITASHSQDLFEHILNPICGTNTTSQFCKNATSYFPMSDDTLRALVVFANYPNGNWDPINTNSNSIYMQFWPVTNNQHLQKPLD